MKKLSLVILIVCFAAGAGFAQTAPSPAAYRQGIEDLATDLAKALPLNSSIGLNWNDAYIGQILDVPPHFGIGFTTGVTMVPYSAVKGFLEDTVGANSIPSIVKGAGLPLPGAVIDARVGGAILPFDVGLKAGGLKFATGDAHVKYFLFGADVRYCVVEQLLAVPKVSVGVGINRMTGNVTVDGVVSGMEIDTTGLGITGASSSVDVSKGDFYMDWKTTVLDFKVQASWDLLIVKPSFGLGASYGMSQIEAGLDSRLTVDGTTTTIPQSAIDALHNQYGLDVSGSGIGYTKKANALAYRLFGGIGINILLVKLDFGLLYNINGGNWGATLGARVQL